MTDGVPASSSHGRGGRGPLPTIQRYRDRHERPNRLAEETSPYLRQHRDNPVDWYPWGAEAFAAAEERNVPILLSVGYSACHWCHVMAHECFEDAEVAAKMNELFVNVKVDREERPDVDALYMDAVQALTGRGGWPMTVFMTPARRAVLRRHLLPEGGVHAADGRHRRRLPQQARGRDARTSRRSPRRVGHRRAASEERCARPRRPQRRTARTWPRAFDAEWGGFGQAPKFPTTSHLELMLRAYMTTAGDGRQARSSRRRSTPCARGGMYDHIGGGFARYSIDREWLVPHFEKMLYDQALLLGVYLKGLIVTGRRRLAAQVVDETIGYVLRELRHPDGGFYSAEDADSPDPDGSTVEGCSTRGRPTRSAPRSPTSTPTWSRRIDWYGITDERQLRGPLDPQPHRRTRAADPPARASTRARRAAPSRPVAAPPARPRRQGAHRVERAVPVVAGRGGGRVRPARLARRRRRQRRVPAARAARRTTAAGTAAGRPTASPARHHGARRRPCCAGRRVHPSGRGDAARRAGSPRRSRPPTRCSTGSGTPSTAGCSPTAEDAEALVVRQKDLIDDATPSANSMAAIALLRLAALTGEQRYANHADRILQLLAAAVDKSPGQYSNALVGDRPAPTRRHRGGRRRRSPRPGAPRPVDLATRHRARLGRALRLTAVARSPRGLRPTSAATTPARLPQDTLQGFAETLTGRKVTITGDTIVTEPTRRPVDRLGYQRPRWMICSAWRRRRGRRCDPVRTPRRPDAAAG